MIKLSSIDLNYLLAQVNILNDYDQLVSPLDPNGVREVSGSDNNLVGGFHYEADGTVTWVGGNINGDWGQADTDFVRMFQTNHPDTGIPQYGVTYDPAHKMPTTDAAGRAPGDAGYELTLVDNPMQMVTQAPGESTRTISQLISSSDVDPNSPTYNPAAAAAMANLGGHAVETSNTVVGTATTAEIPNPGILGGVPYNEWFVAFGQFFDHGLDFITKGAGYVLIPLSPQDPLYDAGAADLMPGDLGYNPMANMMMLSRGSVSNPAGDFYLDGNGNYTLMPGVTPQYNNNTGLLIDQSQTYGSHESINAMLRQYDANGVLTGQLITGADDGNGDAHDLGQWTDLKANALRIGVELIDMDVLDAPMLKVDDIGRITYEPIPVGTLAPGEGYRSDETIAEMASRTGVAESTLTMYDPFQRHPAGTFDAVGNDISGTVMHSNQAILIDIAHGASPVNAMGQPLPAMSSIGDTTGMIPGVDYYNDAVLADHFVSGDGRVNENSGLTAVHHVFHEEHNIQATQIQVQSLFQALESNDLTALNDTDGGWLAEDITTADLDAIRTSTGFAGLDLTDAAMVDAFLASAAFQSAIDGLTWNGEKIYQAARIITETEYNHIAIDQYVTGLYPALPEFVSYSSDINMSVSLEFSQAVFRLGHSQLLETIQIAVPNDSGAPGEPGYVPTYTSVDLFDAFINPAVYEAHGAAAIAQGLINQQGNEIDEFVTSALQQSLVGVPLDLPALNLARGRDVGLPTLNELRQQVFDGLTQNTNNNSNGAGIAPYTSWEDFGGHLRTPESLVNFIAAYGRENATFGLQDARVAYENGHITLQDLRANAQAILDAAADPNDPLHSEAVMFLRGTGEPVYNTTTGTWDINAGNGGDQGFWDIDLWIGGLAEQPLFDGPLGTTFSFVMLDFAQRMQDGDRFYYLYRMPVGHHLGDQIIGEQFADLVMRTTGLEHVNGDVFGYASNTFILDGSNYDNQRDGSYGTLDPLTGMGDGADANGINDYFNAIYEKLPASVKAFALSNGVLADGDLYSQTTATGETLEGGSTLTVTVDLTDGDGAAGGDIGFADVYVFDAVTGEELARENDVLVDNGTTQVSFEIASVAFANDGHEVRVDVQNHVSTAPITVSNVNVSLSSGGGSANDGHIVVAGLDGNDYIIGGLGDDTIYGDAGNDRLEGAQGNDHIYGGDGDDWITDYENDDFISGGAGNDYVSAGPGVLDTIHGNEGDDELHGGDGIDEVFGDDGDDMLFGEGDTDLMLGGEGNDYVDGGDSVDEIFGGNGNDWLRGGVGDDNLNGGSGNDLMEGGLGAVANDGDRLNGDTLPGALPVIEWNGDGTEGDMDIASYEEVSIAVIASLQNSNFNGTSSNLLDTYALNEGIVGSAQDDQLEGADDGGTANNGPQNQLIGGAGADRLAGLGDTDWLYGDAVVVKNNLWVDIEATKALAADGTLASTYDAINNPTGYEVIENWKGTGETRVLFHNADGTTDLGHILGDNGMASDNDVAVFRGNMADYDVSVMPNGVIKVVDLRELPADPATGNHDGTDYLYGVEWAEFADGTMNIALTPPALDLHAADIATVADDFTPSNYSGNDGTANWVGDWVESNDTGGASGGQIFASSFGNDHLRFDSGNGGAIQRVVDLDGATSATLSYDYDENSLDGNERVDVYFAADGVTFDLVQTINSASGNGHFTVALTGPFSATAAVRFEVNSISGNNDDVRIDNVTVEYGSPVDDMSNDYATTFTEGDPEVAIASGPSITDDGLTIASAQIVLTNAKDGDLLHENGVNGDGISGNIDTSVPGQITLTLTGEATLADYQAAIARVTFENTSQAPDETPRVIEVTVNDGFADSNVAISTVDVVNVVDPVNAASDNIVVNFSGNIQVPTWALLDNDFGEMALSVTDAAEIGNQSSFSVDPFTAGDTTISLQKTTGRGRSFEYTATDGVTSDTASVQVSSDTNGTVSGSNGDDIMIGDGAASTFDGRGGDDIVLAGGGDDTIVWGAGLFSNDGHDYVDGGTEGAMGDTFVVNGNFTGEDFVVYARPDAEAAGFTGLRPDTEIVVTRNGAVIAELVDIEEIQINTGGDFGPFDPDTVTMVGDFSPTNLNYNTITINDEDGGDEVDISGLSSDHRIVFNTDANGHVTGETRPQDVVNRGGAPTGEGDGAPVTGDDGPSGSTDGGDTDFGMPTPEFSDPILGTEGADPIVGSGEDDLVIAGGGDDTVLGGEGSDMLFGDAGQDRMFGGDGDDMIEGGADGDTVFAGDGDDWIVDGDGDGNDTYWGGAGNDTLDYSDHAGDVAVNLGNGLNGHGQVMVGTESDAIFGFENVVTGAGDDTITANRAVNVLDGGDGDNVFVFGSAADADGDQILGFNPGDKIDLSGIDADQGTAGHQSFVIFTNGSLNAAGQLNVSYEMRDDGEHTVISGNVSGGDDADFEIDLGGHHSLDASDFNGVS